jgi:AraC-like DNA-binding protein
MALSDTAAAVARVQRYILEHLDEEITLRDLADAAHYSKYHISRIFKALTHRTPLEYVRALRLTRAAEALRNTGGAVIDAAMTSGFDSHDGFTRAFARQFGLTPSRYRAETPMIPAFVHYPIEAYFTLKEGHAPMTNEKVSRTVTVTPVERPARKIIFLRTPGKGYFEDCEAVGCDWEGYFNSIPEKLTRAAMGYLPKNLAAVGGGVSAFFVEVPADYQKPIPANYAIADVPAATYLYFCGMPYDDENDFPIAIGIKSEAVENYPYARMGWRQTDAAPALLELSGDPGAPSEAYIPVERA